MKLNRLLDSGIGIVYMKIEIPKKWNEFQVIFDLESQGQSLPKTIGILTKVFCTTGSNLVILAWTAGALSQGQTQWHTDGWTDTQTDADSNNTQRPWVTN